MIVAIAVGESGISTLLVASQVVLSIVLPFITFPLIYLTSSREIMKARQSRSDTPRIPMTGDDLKVVDKPLDPEAGAEEGYVYFNSGKFMTSIGVLIWLVIVAANIYALVTLGLGQGG